MKLYVHYFIKNQAEQIGETHLITILLLLLLLLLNNHFIYLVFF